MDKYEFRLRIQEIDKLIDAKQYAEAVRIADTIDWRHVKKVSSLVKIAELYKINRRYEECKDLLEIAYDRNPYNKRVVYDLCEVCLEFGDVVSAVEYFKEFAQLAPNEIEIYILKYRLYVANKVGNEEKIEVLEQLRSKTRIGIEEWEYELAYLYHRSGQTAKCVEVCDEIILWNNDGPFVTKAMELKLLHEPLTPQQQYKYDHRNDEKYRVAAMAKNNQAPVGSNTEELGFKVKTIDMSNKFNTINLQAELAQNVSEYLDNTNPIAYNANTDADMTEINFNTTGNIRRTLPQDMMYNSAPIYADGATKVIDTPRMVYHPEYNNAYAEEYGATTVIPSAQVNEAAYEMQNAQAYSQPDGYYAEEVVEELPVETQPAPAEQAQPAQLQPQADEEVFFADKTADIRFAIPDRADASPEVTEEMANFRAQYANGMTADKPVSTDTSDMKEIVFDSNTGEIKAVEVNESVNAEPSRLAGVVTPAAVIAGAAGVQTVSKMDKYLSQNSDGQISMALSEEKRGVEKQITGQMSIDDILSDWENKKANRNTSIHDEINKKVAETTGRILDSSDVESILDTIGKPKPVVVIPESMKEEEVVSPASEETIAEAVAEDAEEAAPEITEPETVAETTETELTENIEPETAQAEAAEPEEEHKYYGQVTDVIPGAIWKEVDEAPMNDTQVEEITNPEEEPVEGEEQPEEASEPVVDSSTEEAMDEKPSEPAINIEPELIPEQSVQTNLVGDISEAINSVENGVNDEDSSDDKEEEEEVAVREITKEEKKLFGAFLYSKSMKTQIVNALDRISLASYTGNIIITSEGTEAGTKLAKTIIKYIQTSDDNFSGAIAKITADKLNQKSVSAVTERVVNGALIVEGASDINEVTVNELLSVLNSEKNGIIVILIDRKGRMKKMVNRTPAIREIFNAKIDVVSMTTDTLVDYGVKYAMKEGYSIDDMALLAFYKRVQDLQAGNHLVTLGEIRAVIDEAIKKGSKKGLGSLTRAISGKKYDDDERIILREKDFDK